MGGRREGSADDTGLPPMRDPASRPAADKPASSPLKRFKAAFGGRPDRLSLADDAAVGRKFSLLAKLVDRPDVVVYDAEHTGIGRRVELHMLPLGLEANGVEAARLIHAARAGARVAHPHIRSVVDSGVDTHGRPFIVYEHVDGLPVREYMKRYPQGLDLRAAAELACQLLEAISCAHTGGVVHRQINDENVVISNVDGVGLRLKLGGFGLAWLRNRPDHVMELPRGYSPFYAPEIRRGDDSISETVDIYATGVLLRQLATGDAREGRPLPEVVARTIARATAEDPDERFRTAEQFMVSVGMLVATRDRPGASIRPPGDPTATSLTADLRYMKRRRDGSLRVRETEDSCSDLELLGVLLVIEALYARLGDGGWGKLARAVPRVTGLLPDSGSADDYAANGVPCNLLAQVLQEADEICGDGFLSLLGPLGEGVATRALPRLCPDLPSALAPDVLVSAIPALWRSLCRSGEVRILERHDGGARISISDQSSPTLELTGLFAGIVRGALRSHGATRAQVNVVSSQSLGDSADIYSISW